MASPHVSFIIDGRQVSFPTPVLTGSGSKGLSQPDKGTPSWIYTVANGPGICKKKYPWSECKSLFYIGK
jgi:hypothetical protein